MTDSSFGDFLRLLASRSAAEDVKDFRSLATALRRLAKIMDGSPMKDEESQTNWGHMAARLRPAAVKSKMTGKKIRRKKRVPLPKLSAEHAAERQRLIDLGLYKTTVPDPPPVDTSGPDHPPLEMMPDGSLRR